jgi:hypothetical protein
MKIQILYSYITIHTISSLPAILLDGIRGYTQVYCPLNPQNSTYNVPLSLPHNEAAAAVILNGSAYFIAGLSTQTNEYTNTVSIVNLDNYETTVGTRLSRARYMHGAAVYNNSVIIVCGGRNSTTCMSECEQYNPSTHTWDMITSLPVQVCSFVMLTLGQYVYTFGGHLCNEGPNTDQVDCVLIKTTKNIVTLQTYMYDGVD